MGSTFNTRGAGGIGRRSGLKIRRGRPRVGSTPTRPTPTMYFDRATLEDLEDKSLAPYGMRSRDTKGRAYLDGEPEFRTTFQRDRDRVLHTTAFRRLEYKTQ